MLKILSDCLKINKVLIRAHKFITGDYYFETTSNNVFEKYYKKAWEWFKQAKYKEDLAMTKEAQDYYTNLDIVINKWNEIKTYVYLNCQVPIFTPERFKNILQNVFSLGQIEKEMVIKHLYFHQELKFSEATVKDKKYIRKFKIIVLFTDIKKLKQVTEQQLMVFEFENNYDQIKSTLVEIESLKYISEKDAEVYSKIDQLTAKMKLKESLLYEFLANKVKQSIKMIEQQLPNIKNVDESIPKQTFQKIVLQSRSDLINIEGCIKFIEDPEIVYKEPTTKINWIEDESEAIDDEIDNLIQDYMTESVQSDTNNFDSFLNKIKSNTITSLQNTNKENMNDDFDDREEFRLSEYLSPGKYRDSITFKFDDDYYDCE